MSAPMTRRVPHPIAVALFPIPALFAVLIAQTPWFGVIVLGCCLLASVWRGLRFAIAMALGSAALCLLLRIGMGFWLPQESALGGAVRITAMAISLIVPAAFVRWTVLTDTLIVHGRVPYRVLDVMVLGERFLQLMRRDLRVATGAATLRARGDAGRRHSAA